ncbi:MAG: hypothetical protein L6R36_009178 [Xanthoria steineri]|nr:MAG: hypothetical protein L6R36_009178 [Xanthoria steineri]
MPPYLLHAGGYKKPSVPRPPASSATAWSTFGARVASESNAAKSGYFAVLPPVPDIELRSQSARPPKASNALSPEESMRAQIEKKLDYHAAATETWLQTIPNAATISEVSPWLEMTRWPKYLGGYSFVETALLAVIPDPVQESLLVEFTKSIERVIEAGYRSIREDKMAYLDRIVQYGEDALRFSTSDPDDITDSDSQEQFKATRNGLDRAILLFSIFLLDHTLKGDLFESILVGFLAVLSIDVTKQTL